MFLGVMQGEKTSTSPDVLIIYDSNKKAFGVVWNIRGETPGFQVNNMMEIEYTLVVLTSKIP